MKKCCAQIKKLYIFRKKIVKQCELPGTDIGPIAIDGMPGMPMPLGPIIGEDTLKIMTSNLAKKLCGKKFLHKTTALKQVYFATHHFTLVFFSRYIVAVRNRVNSAIPHEPHGTFVRAP